jgi:four helix bundle protein
MTLMQYKFEKLEVWKLAMKYNRLIYEIADQLPASEKFNLNSQMRRASTSIALNIAEGSTGQTDAEQARFLSYSIRSYLEVVACLRLIEQRYDMFGTEKLNDNIEKTGSELFAKLQVFKKALK